MSDSITIGSGALTARIASLGAELVSIADAKGAEWMTDGDPAVWSGRSPILFPIVGELAEGKMRLDGAEYDLARHGFARKRAFDCVAHDAETALFRLSDDAETRAVYPFAFELDLHYAARDAMLTMTATVRNTGDGAMPFSIGFHPGFAWPLPGGGEKQAHAVRFMEREAGPIRRLNGDGLLCFFEDTPVVDRRIALHSGLFRADALIWDQLNSRGLRYEGEMPEGEGSPAAIDIAFPDCPMLGIWQKPGADFICLEPWAGHADPVGFDGDFRDKPGVMELEPGAERAFRVTIAIRPAQTGD
ncbi:aldose 1-epimerase family protein [Croceicoccus naphthovorans]|uniref:Aldose epimerase n=1 Tax=Croceicoccus naphthovorans TaxID=1348774 RepID=A0A0G3XFV8_9SPHN|nr:aldose 1-epimerase family protein [Croceicoccus naphthovorans]AKM09263.1 aldose epimerase [Croceicoccus naphthovorans]MBB3990160.1 galactose mutarotase-like enzyme [Croceicoccus naphthovorans]